MKKARLIRILPDWTFGANAGVYLVRPFSAYTSARVDAFKTYIETRFAGGAPWEHREDLSRQHWEKNDGKKTKK